MPERSQIANATNSRLILGTIVIAQFLCTSLWFAGNAVTADLIEFFNFPDQALGYLLSSVQIGFIAGTAIFAFFRIADFFSPSKVFFSSALLAAVFNVCIAFFEGILITSILFRFLTGFFLAGIYPVGMKIAADHFDQNLGKSLGLLVGALVLGTATPHLIRSLDQGLNWQMVFYSTSTLSVFGGLSMLLFVPDGPFRSVSQGLQKIKIRALFEDVRFRAASNGYFGHMWELYTFWAFTPFMLTLWTDMHLEVLIPIPLYSFLIIGIGSIACVISTRIAHSRGSKKIAGLMLSISGLCCLLFPFLLQVSSFYLFLAFMLIWGFAVIADSPLFSTLIAQTANPAIKGTALTLVNGIGFGITILSIELMNALTTQFESPYIFLILGLGPIYGLIQLVKPSKDLGSSPDLQGIE